MKASVGLGGIENGLHCSHWAVTVIDQKVELEEGR